MAARYSNYIWLEVGHYSQGTYGLLYCTRHLRIWYLLVHFPKDLTFSNKIMNSELIQGDFSRASIQIICPYPLQDANNIVVNLVDSMDAKIQTILCSALLTVWTPRYKQYCFQPCWQYGCQDTNHVQGFIITCKICSILYSLLLVIWNSCRYTCNFGL
jgi:hypothetical protein